MTAADSLVDHELVQLVARVFQPTAANTRPGGPGGRAEAVPVPDRRHAAAC